MLTRLLVAAALSVAASGAAPLPQSPPPSHNAPARAVSANLQDARGPAWFRAKEEFERRKLQESGLPSLADLAAEGREVVQIALEDGYSTGINSPPAMQIEKVGADATLTMFNRQGPIMTIPLTGDEWHRIYDTDLNPGPSSPPGGDDNPYIDHSPIARVGWAGGGESVTHSAVNSDPGMAIADFAARLALKSSTDCEVEYRSDQSRFRTLNMFQYCFGPRR